MRSTRLLGSILLVLGVVAVAAGLFVDAFGLTVAGAIVCAIAIVVVLTPAPSSAPPVAVPPVVSPPVPRTATAPPMPTVPVTAAPAVTDAAEPASTRPPGGAAPVPTAETSPAAPAFTPQSAPEDAQPRGPQPPVRPVIVAAPGVEPRDVVGALERSAAVAGRVHTVALWLEDSPSDTIRLVAASGPVRPPAEPVRLEGTDVGRSLASRAAVLTPLDPDDPDSRSSRYTMPLCAGDTRGAVTIDFAGDVDREALTTVSAHFRGALTGALALFVARQESSASKLLLAAARDLARQLDPSVICSMLVDRATTLASSQTASVMLADDDGLLSIRASVGLPTDVAMTARVSSGEGIAGWVYATGEPLVVEDLQGATPRGRRHGICSAVAVPIADEDGILGVLNVGNTEFQTRFSKSHVDTLEALARIGAVALRNAWAAHESRGLFFDTLRALALALETKDPFSRGSTERVLDLATALGRAVGLVGIESEALRVAALLHDVGMPAVGEAAVMEDRPLTTVEWGLLKMHPAIAADALAQAPALRAAVPIVYHHHERFDGSGYVAGLSGEQIPLGARVLSVADAFVSMTSDRPYRKAMAQAEAVAEIRKGAGTQFDPTVVKALERVTDTPAEAADCQPQTTTAAP